MVEIGIAAAAAVTVEKAGTVTARPAENAEVSLFGSVAVAVMTWPGARATANVAVKVALPVASVVTLTNPGRFVLDSFRKDC